MRARRSAASDAYDLRRTFATWLKQRDVDSAVVAAMMGHSSTAMVDRVYGKLDAANFRRAIAKLPGGAVSPASKQEEGSHAGVTSISQTLGEHGADGTTADQAAVANYVEDCCGVSAGELGPSIIGYESLEQFRRLR